MELPNPQQSGAPPVAAAYPTQPQYHHLLQQHLQIFWNYQRQEIEQVNDFKNQKVPLARIKKIMKADEDVRMIAVESPVLFAKACELFTLELTIRSWLHAEVTKRRTLQKYDIVAVITSTYIFDFLVHIVRGEEIKDEAAALGGMSMPPEPGVTGGPYYDPPMGQPMLGPPGVDPGVVYVQPPPPSQSWQSVWQAEADVRSTGRPYYYPPMGQPMLGPPGVDPGVVYVQPPPPSQSWQSVWQAAADVRSTGRPYYYPPMGQPMLGPPGVDPGVVYVQPPPPSQSLESVWQAMEDGSYAGEGQGNLDGQGGNNWTADPR